jgi:hypothetical protein
MESNPSPDQAVPREVYSDQACPANAKRKSQQTRAVLKCPIREASSALRYVWSIVTSSRPGQSSHYGALHAGTAAALQGGATVAADFCIGLARELAL